MSLRTRVLDGFPLFLVNRTLHAPAHRCHLPPCHVPWTIDTCQGRVWRCGTCDLAELPVLKQTTLQMFHLIHLSCCKMGFPTGWVIEAEEKPLVVDQKALQSLGGSDITEMRQRYVLLRYRGPQCCCRCKMLLECRVPRKQTGYQCKTGQQTS